MCYRRGRLLHALYLMVRFYDEKETGKKMFVHVVKAVNIRIFVKQ